MIFRPPSTFWPLSRTDAHWPLSLIASCPWRTLLCLRRARWRWWRVIRPISSSARTSRKMQRMPFDLPISSRVIPGQREAPTPAAARRPRDFRFLDHRVRPKLLRRRSPRQRPWVFQGTGMATTSTSRAHRFRMSPSRFSAKDCWDHCGNCVIDAAEERYNHPPEF